MPKNRKAAENVIVTYIEKMLPGGGNKEMYEKLFAGMSDDEFDRFMTRLEEGQIHLAIVAPNLRKPMLETKRNYDIARELGHEFFERIWMDPKNGSPAYLSPVKYLVVDLPLRRQAQLQVKKISIPEHNRSVDNLTGQPTGASKGSKISYPELNILASLKLDNSIVELIKFRGGDTQGFNAMNDFIYRTGGVSQTAISALGTEVKATRALSTFLLGMHLSNTLTQ